MPKQGKALALKKTKSLPTPNMATRFPAVANPETPEAMSIDLPEQNLSPLSACDKTPPYIPSRSPSPMGLLSPFKSNIFPQSQARKTLKANSFFRQCFSEQASKMPSLPTKLTLTSPRLASHMTKGNKTHNELGSQISPRKTSFHTKLRLMSENQTSETFHAASSVEDYCLQTQKTVRLRPSSPEPSPQLFSDEQISTNPLQSRSPELSRTDSSQKKIRVMSPVVPPRRLSDKGSEDHSIATSRTLSWNSASESCGFFSASRTPSVATFPQVTSGNKLSGKGKRCRICGWMDCPLDDSLITQFLHQLYPKLQL